MRVALDTNLIVRHLTSDHPTESPAAKAIIDGDDVLVISTVVLCELAWVLRGRYRYPRTDLADALRDLIDSENVEVDRPAAEAGLRMLARGGDFADGVIEHESTRAKCDRLVTFDKTSARCAATSRVTLL